MQRANYSHLMCCTRISTCIYEEMYLNSIYIDIKVYKLVHKFKWNMLFEFLWTKKKRWIDLLTFILHFMICIPSDIILKSKDKSIDIRPVRRFYYLNDYNYIIICFAKSIKDENTWKV